MSGKAGRNANSAEAELQKQQFMMEQEQSRRAAEMQAAQQQQQQQMQFDALVPVVGEEVAAGVVFGGQELKDLKPEQTAAMQNAASMGLKPGTAEYNDYITKVTQKGGITVNNQAPPQFGSIDKGHMMKQDEQGNYYQVPIPGSPAELEAKTRKSKAGMKGLSAFQDANNINSVIDNAIASADGWTTGIGGAATGWIPGTPAHNLGENLKTIEADAAFSSLQNMRDNSVTGGALGQVSERELGLLSSAKAALSQSQSEEQFKENLIRYKEARNQAMLNTAKAYEQDYGVKAPWMPEETSQQQPSQQQSFEEGQTATNPTTGERMIFRNGQWVAQ
jgi:hypothetical protein